MLNCRHFVKTNFFFGSWGHLFSAWMNCWNWHHMGLLQWRCRSDWAAGSGFQKQLWGAWWHQSWCLTRQQRSGWKVYEVCRDCFWYLLCWGLLHDPMFWKAASENCLLQFVLMQRWWALRNLILYISRQNEVHHRSCHAWFAGCKAFWDSWWYYFY